MNCSGKIELVDVEPGDEIVISGMAGRFPKSDNIRQLQNNLFDKRDLGSDDERRWMHEYLDVPKRTGKVNNLEKFDAKYFDMPFNQAHLIDPMTRCLLEHAYEAIVDAGINPKDLKDTNTGVIVGTSFLESEKTLLYDKLQVAGHGLLGCTKSLLANLVSQRLGLNGPSCILDSACSSTIYIMEYAYRMMKVEECDAMIVAGSNLCLNSMLSLHFKRLGVLSPDGFCRPFDNRANGYMRSETIGTVFLQKTKNAKRIYATLIYAKTNCDGYKEQGITFPSSEMQSILLEEFYDECGISPNSIPYFETHGTSTIVGDPEEVNAIEKVFCKNRQSPLLIGSVKSNLGHAEPAAGICQIAKVVIAMETGVIPPNINFKHRRSDIEAFKRETIRVVSTSTPWEPTLVPISSFGFGGANAHILLAPNMKHKINGGEPKDNLPRLVVLSGRTEEAVESFLHEIESQPIDVEYVRLLYDIYADEMQGHPYRGYTIVKSQMSRNVINEIQHYSRIKKPICFVLSGVESYWPSMGEALLRFPTFFKAVEKCNTILRTNGIHINDILTNKQKGTYSILNSVVNIIAMQIGLIDLLMSVNIVPDYVIGHSIGELCCGYVTGDLTTEQVILSAYYIGLALSEIKIVQYARADIGLGYKKLKDICPADIEVICSYSPNACSISGPRESVKEFVTKLQASKIFTKEGTCNTVSLHNFYFAVAINKIFTHLKQTIPQKMAHSQIWRRLFCDRELTYAEYFANNLTKPVLFEDVTNIIPKNAIFVEMASDGILHGVLNEIFDTTHITLTQRESVDNVMVFLQGLGKMYNCGLQPRLFNLYPTVEFPVSRGTPMISSSIKWDHSENWYVSFDIVQKQITSGERVVNISLKDEVYEYLSGHVIDGRILLPAMGYIDLIWKTIGMLRGEHQYNVSVVFENVKFLRATHIASQGDVELTLMIQKATGKFEIIEGNTTVVTGRVRACSDPSTERIPMDYLKENDNEEEVMKTKDIYKELKLRGYQYAGLFRGLKSSSTKGRQGHIVWWNNYVTFMDNMLQMQILGTDTRNLYVPTGIQKLVIDPKFHSQHVQNIPTEEKHLAVRVYKDLGTIISGGVEISGITATPISRRKPTGYPVLEEYGFIAHRDGAKVSFEESVILSTHLVLEYHQIMRVNMIELIEEEDEITTNKLASPLLVEILNNLPLIQSNITLVARDSRFDQVTLPPKVTVSQSKKLSREDNVILVIGCNLFMKGKHDTLIEILKALKSDGFLLTRGQSLTKEDIANAERYDLTVVLEKNTGNEYITLLKKRGKSTSKTEVIYANNHEFSWLEKLKSILNTENELTITTRVIIVGEGDSECGILGLVNCLRREPGGELIRGVFIQDENAPKFSLHDPFYAEQLQLDLVINVLRPGKIWGSYRHLPLPPVKPKLVYHALANQLVRGDLSSLRWIEGTITRENENRPINIIYASLNFKDVMTATGKINLDAFMSRGRLEDCMLGLEYVGIDETGRRMMGLTENRSISNKQIRHKYLSWEIPDEWTLEDAATVTCAYSTCYYGFYLSGELKKGEKILIHSGTGAVGQAAINIALHTGCEIFLTVGTSAKRTFVRDNFPSIPEDHIGNSRDTSFEQMIYQQTDGRGVDVVLNSLAEDKLQASVRCLARGGRFLEIGKFDMMTNNTLDITVFSKGIKFYSVMLERVFLQSIPPEDGEYLHEMFVAGLESGAIKPLPRKVFGRDEVETAFRYMAKGKHIGKIIIKVQEDEKFIGEPILALPRYYCIPDKTYIILGGLGGFGLELVDWLVIRGAKNLVLVSRAGIKNGYQRMKVNQWESYGVKVLIVSNVDTSNIGDCEHILRTAQELAPTDAIFNLAVVLNDKICQNHTTETFLEPFKAKAWATQNLDELSRKLCPQLRHFVVFSSVSCGRGNAGQSNYGMANSIMERICERRLQDGLHGLAIQWGAIGDVGLVADMQENDKELVIGGTLHQRISSCIEKLEEFLLQEQPVVASMVVAEKRLHAVSAISVVETVANIMGLIDLSSVPGNARLSEIGMDSMMAVEIKQTLEREYGILLTAQDIRDISFAKLTEMFDQDAQNKKLRTDNLRDPNDFAGLKLLVRVIGDDDLIPDICMNLPTKGDVTRNEIFLLPGIEGCGNTFNLLAPKIEAPATCLQYGTYNIGNNCHTITEIADCLLKHILDKMKFKRNFVIVAYSFGSLIGIELVRKLEEMKLNGRLVLIDGAPEQMKALMNQHLPFSTIDELQSNVLLSIMDMLHPVISGKLLLELNKCTNWDDKLSMFISHLPPAYSKYSIDCSRALCVTFYKHIRALHEYDVTQVPKIVSPVILLKPTVQSLHFPDNDYGLYKITKGNVEIHHVEGNHLTILDSGKVVAAINGQQIEGVKKIQPSMIDDNMISVGSNRTRS